MKVIKNLLLVIIVISFSLSSMNCESTSTDPKENIPANVPADVVGNWEAASYLISNNANSTELVDLVFEGYSLHLTIQSNGAYSSTLSFPGVPDETESGTATFVGNIVTIDPSDDDPFPMTYILADSILNLVDVNSTFDFDDDGMDEAATESIFLLRQ